MEERGKKPTLCGVLFMDIEEYSRKTVSEQIALKVGFNAILTRALRDVSTNDRIILDTGDGAAICFLGDIDNALKVALRMRDGLFSKSANTNPPLQVRMGINYGPVRLVKNSSGQSNIVGDGINVAQRVKGFANPGHILASRSYYDAVSRFSQEYAGMFHHQGSRTDKHVREHELYAFSPPGELAVPPQGLMHGDELKAADKHDAKLRQASWRQQALYVGALVLLAIALFKVAHRDEVQNSATQAPPMAEVHVQQAAPQTADVDAVIPHRMVEPITEQKQETPGNIPGVQKILSVRPDVLKEGGLQPAPSAPRREHTVAVQGAMAKVTIAITPWGEVYLDGRMRGISPPLVELKVTPGKHEIEIRNTTFPVYTKSIQVKAGEEIKIRHKFTD